MIDANQGDNTISVFLGNGDGTFAAQTTVPTGKGPVAMIAEDFNRDGNMDLAVVNQTDATVLILLGNGDGTFTTGQTIAVGQGAVSIAAADFNSDGFLDLAVANQTDNTVTILLGKGDGTFTAGTTFPTRQHSSRARRPQDFNADGHIDLAVVNQGANSVSIFLGNGDGTFGTRNDYATGTLPSGIADADFNNDGHLGPGDFQPDRQHRFDLAGQWRRHVRRADDIRHRYRTDRDSDRRFQWRRHSRPDHRKPDGE